MQRRCELLLWLPFIQGPELCLFAHVLHSLEQNKLDIFHVLTVQIVLVLEGVNFCLSGFPPLERDHTGSGTKHIFDIVSDITSKDS